MRFTGVVASVAIAVLGASAALFACSSSDGTPAPPDEAGTPDAPAQREGSTDEPDSARPCVPQALAEQPKWNPPTALGQNACTPAQVDGYVQACFTSGNPATCTAFGQQNADCFKCIESKPTDPNGAALLWYDDHGWFEPNVPGCVARAQNDLSEDGCGARAHLTSECGRLACRGCSPVSTEREYEDLRKCRVKPEVEMTCASFLARSQLKCANIFAGASPELARCATPDTNTTEENLRHYVNLWCTSPADAGSD